MKMIYCTCNISVLDELIELVKAQNIDNYQVVEKITGQDLVGDPRLNTAVWPGFNSQVVSIVEAKKVPQLSRAIKAYNQRAINRNEIITFCSWEVEEFISQ